LSGACGYNLDDVCDSVKNATVDGAFAAYFSSVESVLTRQCTQSQQTEVSCDDGLDNDCDGAIDGVDSDCGPCTPTENSESSCFDGQDNDCDGATDGADSDCNACTVTENPEVSCGDGQDNDCDGTTDGADSDCPVVGGGFGDSCEVNSECLSNKCKGKSGAKTCK
jgi:hypothetical protein